MRIVLDTNSLIIALSSKNKYGVVWKAFLEGAILCACRMRFLKNT